jgi:hypothetical protein
MSRLSVLLVILTLALCSSASFSKDEHTFACNAQSFDLSSFEGETSTSSPDGRNHIQLRRDYTYAVFVRDKQVTRLEYLDTNCCIEIGWSPDSSQFFVSYSNSATYHQYKTHLFSIVGERVSENRAPQTVFDDFGSQHSCPSRGGNNLFLLGWTKDSQSVFLVSEVTPTGDCGKEAGVYGGYLVKVRDGTIGHRYGQKQTDTIEKACRAGGILHADSLK